MPVIQFSTDAPLQRLQPEFEAERFDAMHLAANAEYGPRRDSIDRWREAQAAVQVPALLRQSGQDDLAKRMDAIAAEKWKRDPQGAQGGQGARHDSFGPGGNLYMARQLEYVYRKVLEEVRPPLNGLAMFPLDSEVPVGAKTHTARRFLQTGEAKIHRGTNTDVPQADINQVEETFPVHYLVTSTRMNLFEMLASNFANVQAAQGKMRSARRAFETLLNALIWNGSPADGLYGILNYPYLYKILMSTAFDGSASPDAVVAALNYLANFAANNSKTAFQSDRMRVSPRLRSYLFNTRIGSVSEMTIGKFFLENQEYIKSIDAAQELQGVGPGGTDAILVHSSDPDAISVVVPQGLTVLPPQYSMFDQLTPMWGSYGGVVMRNVGSNILGWVTPPTSL